MFQAQQAGVLIRYTTRELLLVSVEKGSMISRYKKNLAELIKVEPHKQADISMLHDHDRCVAEPSSFKLDSGTCRQPYTLRCTEGQDIMGSCQNKM